MAVFRYILSSYIANHLLPNLKFDPQIRRINSFRIQQCSFYCRELVRERWFEYPKLLVYRIPPPPSGNSDYSLYAHTFFRLTLFRGLTIISTASKVSEYFLSMVEHLLMYETIFKSLKILSKITEFKIPLHFRRSILCIFFYAKRCYHASVGQSFSQGITSQHLKIFHETPRQVNYFQPNILLISTWLQRILIGATERLYITSLLKMNLFFQFLQLSTAVNWALSTAH